MTDRAIRVENLSKRYRIGALQAGTRTLRETLTDFALAPLRRLRRNGRGPEGDNFIWALRGVSFEVQPGEAIGIIGRNGAGKSTLLKILSRITEPTEGYVELNGRVGALLEVGTGFHPELTGRENVHLNGAILGMRRSEIQRKFDEIVDFSGVEKFIDTPVKFYSSGMKVRLAFAVAAHLEPEILFVDEVLAVGDAEFQEKCLGKMSVVAQGGRTVMFVSHNLTAISGLCQRTMYLEGGQLITAGETQQIIDQYLKAIRGRQGVSLAERRDRSGNGHIRFTAAALQNAAGEPIVAVQSGQELRFILDYAGQDGDRLDGVKAQIEIENIHQQKLFYCSNDLIGATWGELPPAGRMVCLIPELPLAPGHYSFHLVCSRKRDVLDRVNYAGNFEVAGGDYFGTGRAPSSKKGSMLVRHSWRIESGVDDVLHAS